MEVLDNEALLFGLDVEAALEDGGEYLGGDKFGLLLLALLAFGEGEEGFLEFG